MSLSREHVAAVMTVAVFFLLQGSINVERLEHDFLPEPGRVIQFAVTPFPVAVAATPAPDISAHTAVVVDEASGAVLLDKGANQAVSPASTTKLMTALVARATYEPNEVLTVPNLRGISGNTAGLRTGQQYTLEALLEAALIPSGNDAAYTLAANHPAGEEAFIIAMNEKARRLHLTRTQYQNAVGYDHELQQTSAYDLALLGREVLKDELLARIVGTKEATLLDLTGKYPHTVTTTNQLLLTDDRVVGIKTGTTGEAGEVLISQFVLENHPVTVVVMGSTDRYTDTRRIIDWVLQEYIWRTVE